MAAGTPGGGRLVEPKEIVGPEMELDQKIWRKSSE